jgi:small subunit ribosomal protein S16
VLEELGHYDPMVRETDARAQLNGDRIEYWLGVGAQPTEKVRVLIAKYGKNGSHRDAQQAAVERLKASKPMAPPPRPVRLAKPKAQDEPTAEEAPDSSQETTTAEGAETQT